MVLHELQILKFGFKRKQLNLEEQYDDNGVLISHDHNMIFDVYFDEKVISFKKH